VGRSELGKQGKEMARRRTTNHQENSAEAEEK
jgi:hypothetical protein